MPLAGTVAGVVDGIQLCKGLRSGKKRRFVLHLGQVEPANKHIRSKPGSDMRRSPMGTAAEKVSLLSFCDQQILFMAEGFRFPTPVFHYIHSLIACIFRSLPAGVNYDPRGKLPFPRDEYEPFPGKALIQADILFFSMVVLVEGIWTGIDFRLLIDFQESAQSPAVVIMPMRQYAKIHIGQVNSQFFPILRKRTGLPGIKENPYTICFYI